MKNEFDPVKKPEEPEKIGETMENPGEVKDVVKETPKTPESPKQTQKPDQKKPERCKVVDCAKLNIREEPVGDAVVAGTIERGTIIYVDPEFDENGFKRVVEGPVIGYAKADYLELI